MPKRKRNNRIQVRLSDDELAFFEYNLEKTGLSREAYLRQLIVNKTPKTKEVNEANQNILAQLYGIGNNLNQIARLAHTLKVINAERYDEAVEQFKTVMKKFLDTC